MPIARAVVGATARPDVGAAVLADGALTRFAPAPTGFLHLGHIANAIHVWGIARTLKGRVLLRIEDHDRQRCRPEFDAALLEDLSWLGFVPDLGPVRQSDDDAPYLDALDRLLGTGDAYGCDCSRSTFRAWAAANGQPWSGPGCPGGCRMRELDGPVMRVSLGSGGESWVDGSLGSISTAVGPRGDLPIRDRLGNWTYGLCVVVDDLRQDIGLVVRGRDLLDTTADQIRLARLLGRDAAPVFHHHPLILRPDGSKLSKSSGDTGVRELRAAGWSAADVRHAAADATGWTADPT